MVLKCLGSGSSGNCYLFGAKEETLILECGLSFLEIKKALNFQLDKVVGCLVTHEHRDHSKCLKDIVKSGIKVLALKEVFDSHDMRDNVFCKVVKPLSGYKVGGFKVFAFPVSHDVPCVGFLIEHDEMGRTFFATDTMMLEYRLPKCNHLMIEANYDDKILQARIDDGVIPRVMRERLMRSHMELGTAKRLISENDMTSVSEVILIHLSDNNSDPHLFKNEIESVCGLPTYIAKKGFEIELLNQ